MIQNQIQENLTNSSEFGGGNWIATKFKLIIMPVHLSQGSDTGHCMISYING